MPIEIVPAMKGVELAMSTMVRFKDGVRVSIRMREHNPPHFHIMRGKQKIAGVNIADLTFRSKPVDIKATKKPLEWAAKVENKVKMVAEFYRLNPYLKSKTESKDAGRPKMAKRYKLPEVTEELAMKLYAKYPEDNRGFKKVKPGKGTLLHITWSDGHKDVLDMALALERDPEVELFKDRKFFEKVRISDHGVYLKWPKRGFKFPDDRIWLDCRLQELYRKKPKKAKQEKEDQDGE